MPTIRTYKLLILILVQSAWNALLSKVEYNILMENLRSKSHHTKAFLKRFFTRSIYLRGPTRSFNPFVRQAKSNEIEVVPKDFTSVCSGMLRNPSDKCILDDADSELTNIGPQNQLISPRSSSKLSWSDIKSCDECSVCFDALRPDSSRSNTKIRANPSFECLSVVMYSTLHASKLGWFLEVQIVPTVVRASKNSCFA